MEETRPLIRVPGGLFSLAALTGVAAGLAAVAAKVPQVQCESGHYHDCLIAQRRRIPENVINCPSLSKSTLG